MGDEEADGGEKRVEALEPAHNREYKTHEYWEQRFAKEASYEWLASYEVVRACLTPWLTRLRAPKSHVLVVGCGNSGLSAGLAEDGVQLVTSIDFSAKVIEAMAAQHAGNAQLRWQVMDMTAMTFPEETFDVVIDKAAMDALVTDEGDPWNPNQATVDATAAMMESVARVLKPGGAFCQISFQQPHFRKRYLAHPALSAPAVTEIDHGMGYFLFSQEKCAAAPAQPAEPGPGE